MISYDIAAARDDSERGYASHSSTNGIYNQALYNQNTASTYHITTDDPVLIIPSSSNSVCLLYSNRISGTFVCKRCLSINVSNTMRPHTSRLGETGTPREKRTETYPIDVVAGSSREIPLVSEPTTLDLHLKSALDDRVTCKLCKGTLW